MFMPNIEENNINNPKNTDCLSYDLTNPVCKSPSYKNHSGFDQIIFCFLGLIEINW